MYFSYFPDHISQNWMQLMWTMVEMHYLAPTCTYFLICHPDPLAEQSFQFIQYITNSEAYALALFNKIFCHWPLWIAFIPVHLIATDICFDHINLIMPNIGSMGDTVKAVQALPFKIYNSLLPSMVVVICISRKHIPALSPPPKVLASSPGWGGVWAGRPHVNT